MVYSYTKLFYVCRCDNCNKSETIEGARNVTYNSAQAVRSLGWSYSRKGKVLCSDCKRKDLNNKYRYK